MEEKGSAFALKGTQSNAFEEPDGKAIDTDTLSKMWNEALWGKNPYKSIDIYTDLLKQNPESHIILNNRGIKFLETNDFDSAVNDFKQGLALSNHDTHLLRLLAMAYAYKNDFENALETIEKAIISDKNDYSCVTTKAEILIRQKNLSDATQTLNSLMLYADFNKSPYEKEKTEFLFGLIHF